MAVDGATMRKDIFNLLTMFGPANVGGPPQANTNPGARAPVQNAQLPPPGSEPEADAPAPGAQPAEFRPPIPQGVRTLPPGTPVQDNSEAASAAGTTADLRNQVIELLPGDADPNMLPPEIRDSWMFRYEQARRAAAYKVAEEQARWQNFVGGIGNIAQIASGGRPTNETGIRPKGPDAIDVGTMYGWKKDYDALQLALAQKAEMRRTAYAYAAQNGIPKESIDMLIATGKLDKLADLGFNTSDPEARAKAVKAQLEAVEKSQSLTPAGLTSPETLAAIHERFPEIPMEYLKNMPAPALQALVKEVSVAREQNTGAARTTLASGDVKEASEGNRTMASILARNAQAQRTIENGGIVGGGFTDTDIENKLREWGSRVTGFGSKQQANQAAVLALTAKNALDLGAGLKGSTSNRDMELLQKAAGGAANMTADEMSRVLAINNLVARRAIDENNARLTAAGKALNQDVAGKMPKVPRLTKAEMREIDPQLIALSFTDPELAQNELEALYGPSATKEILSRVDEVVEARLHTTPPKEPGNKTLQADTNITHGRTVLDADANDLFRSYSADELAARREAIVAKLDALDAGTGAATYELMLAAKRAGAFGPKGKR